ncbi:PREDICTED: uncharacterized protein LOC107327953 [Acropora digitifera]|uniref:uncharacterized protein LOC107327953 n=1 Tax=Acropora digitifera TaxID=70779 RepID=UPI00077AB06F|nr:PREDICTED: uncharacterized protein LOC107327953 [Acropora digitifera]
MIMTNLYLILGSFDITTQGQWWGDMFNGEGSMIHTSGVSYEGMWINGRPEAEGRQICIVGEEYVEVTQGRPFGFEVECVTIDGEPTQEEGRSLQVTAGIKVGALKRSADSTEAEVDTMMTPFGFEIEPYPLTEMLGEVASETALQYHPQQVASVMSSIPYQASPPVGDELAKNVDNLQITDGSDTLGDKESFTADHVQPSEILNRTAPPSQGSAGFPNGHDKNATADADLLTDPPTVILPPVVSPVRTKAGKAMFENVLIPPLPPGVRIWNSFAAIQESLHELAKNAETRGLTSKFKSKVTVAVASNTLKGANRAATEAGKKKKDSGSADMMEKMDGKRKKEKKEEKDDKFCRPGDYVVIVEDVTSPPFLDVTLAPAFLHVKVTPKKRAKSKMESRKT